MKSLKGTQTEKNLLAAFAGESQARNRYTYFASEAKKAGYEQISALFLETADNEKEHAKIFFKYLQGGMASSARQKRTSKRRPMGKKQNGEPFTLSFPPWRKRKGSLKSREVFNKSQKSSSTMSNDTERFWQTSRPSRCSREKKS